MPVRPAAVLFDLDGTLLDTAPDMGRALNQLRQENGLAALSPAAIRPYVSHGSLGLIKLGFSISEAEVEFVPLRQRFLEIYHHMLSWETRLFGGMATVLNALEQNGIAWGVVTNKPGWLTEPLLQALDLFQRAACVVSGDTLATRKPDPAPIQYACQLIQQSPSDCVYIGDAQRDMQAAQASGMPAWLAAYGYLHPDDPITTWGVDIMLQHPLDVLTQLALSQPSTRISLA